MSSLPTRAFFRASAIVIVAFGLVVAPVPQASGRRFPPTVMRTGRVSLTELIPRAAQARREAGLSVERALWTRTDTVCAPIQFTAVGLTWRQDSARAVDAVLTIDGKRRVRVEADPSEGPDAGSPEDSRIDGTPPVWTGNGRCLSFRLRLPADVAFRDARVVFLNTSGTADGGPPPPDPGPPPGSASAWTNQPSLHTRPDWNARPPRCGPYYADRLKMAYVHHTDNANGYTRGQVDDILRAIQAYHMDARGFCDIAYHFLIDRFGRKWVGRAGGIDKPVIGAHAAGFNWETAGVATIGNFMQHSPPSEVISAYKHLLAWRLDFAHESPTARIKMTSAGGGTSKYGKGETVRLPVVSGHRRTSYTDCPGDRLNAKLDVIRHGAKEIGLPKIFRTKPWDATMVAGQDQVTWRSHLSRTMDWTLTVRNAADPTSDPVHTASGHDDLVLDTWDGTKNGVPIPDGAYTVTIEARTGGGAEARPAILALTVTSVVP